MAVPDIFHRLLGRKTLIRAGLMGGMLLASMGILAILVYREREVLFTYQWELQPIPILISFGLYSAILFLVVGIWADMMNKLGVRVGYWQHFRYFCIANLAKRLPGTVWYVAGRAEFYKGEGITRRVTSLVSGVEMIVAIIAAIIVSILFGLPILIRYQFSFWPLAGGLLVSIVLLHPRILRYLMNKFGIDGNWCGYKDLLVWIGGYILAWGIGGGVLFAISNTIEYVSFTHLGYMIGSWSLVGLLGYVFFFSPSNLGVSEVGYSLLLSTVMPAPVAVVVALGVRFLSIVYEIVWAIVSIGLKTRGLSGN